MVLVDDDLSLDEQLRVAHEVADIRGVRALHSLMYVKRETYDPLGPRLLNGTTGETALPPWGLSFRER